MRKKSTVALEKRRHASSEGAKENALCERRAAARSELAFSAPFAPDA